jgi:hypothetical protein
MFTEDFLLQVKNDEVCGLVERVGEIRITYNILIGKPDGKCPQRRHVEKWQDNIKFILNNRV